MKAIIVDDERRTRKFFCSVIDWTSIGIDDVLEASDGEEAYHLIQEEKPEILFIDMCMPRKDGVELLQLLRSLPYPHRTIVVSGFDDYHYMKKTIEYGGFDYFTKPIDEIEVTARLREAVRELEQEKEAAARIDISAMVFHEQKRLLQDGLMTQWIDRPGMRADIVSQLEEDWSPGFGRPYSLCLCRVNERAGRMERLHADSKHSFDSSFLKAAGELMHFPEHGMGFRYLSAPNTVMFIVYGTGDATASCRELARRIFGLFRIRIEIAIARGASFPEDLGTVSAAAFSTWEGINQLAPDPDRVYDRPADFAGLLSLLERERELRDMLLSIRNAEGIHRFTRKLLNECCESGSLTNRQILWWERELKWFGEPWIESELPELLGAQAAEEEGSVGLPALVYWDDAGAFSLEKLAESLVGCLEKLSRISVAASRRKRSNTVDDIRDYLERHYCEPFMIRDLAAQFYLNAEYVARLFKHKFGIGIKEFVTALRIRHAKLLMGNSFLKIADIAEKVGFADEKYFSKVFKKETGMTPQQYRRTEGGAGA
ncbi:AraC family transcriptional regulator [Paenibacillus hexagrammi]|uniref:Response regulator n=1 Tax=Paenibacillus hexagrammi TaxID=2908839 RepID=A0ABY3SJ12_9BACL|nr:response regulator [Paenibacillus sp. YPD9-1]UJF33998.1 response regulator [Paenibacillus sp. YPD9-1]